MLTKKVTELLDVDVNLFISCSEILFELLVEGINATYIKKLKKRITLHN